MFWVLWIDLAPNPDMITVKPSQRQKKQQLKELAATLQIQDFGPNFQITH
jgi:hypothetical protein